MDSINVKDHANTINNLYSLYNSIGDYEKGFIDEDDVKAMNSYVAKLNELLIQLANEAAKEQEAKEAAENAQTQPDDTSIAENAAAQGAVTPEED